MNSVNSATVGCLRLSPESNTKVMRPTGQSSPTPLPSSHTDDNISAELPLTPEMKLPALPTTPLSQSDVDGMSNPDSTDNTIQFDIVRHVASYLSLSDVESIGTLYSFFPRICEKKIHDPSSPPPLQKVRHSRIKRNGGARCGGDQTSQTTTQARHQHYSTSRSSSHEIRPSPILDQFHNVFSNDDTKGNDDATKLMVETKNFPDECAGLESDVPRHTTNRIATTSTDSTESGTVVKDVCINMENCKVKKQMETAVKGMTGAIGINNHTPPGLIAISPILNDRYCDYNNINEIQSVSTHSTNANYWNNEDDLSEDSQDNYLFGQGDESPSQNQMSYKRLDNREETIQFKKSQQILRKVVLTQQQSIRSFSQSLCLKEKQEKIQMKKQSSLKPTKQSPLKPKKGSGQKETSWSSRRKKDQLSRTPSPLSSVCPSCYLLLTGEGSAAHEKEINLFGDGKNSPAVLSISDDEDAAAGKETGERNDYLSHLVECPSCSKEQRHRHFQQHVPPPPPHSWLLRLFTDPIFQNIPLSIIFDASSSSLHTLLKTFESGIILTSTSIKSIIKILTFSIHASCSNLASNLHPKRLVEFCIHLYQYAMRSYNTFSSASSRRRGVVSQTVSSVKNRVAGSYVGTSATAMVQALYSNNNGTVASSYSGSCGLDSDLCTRFSYDIEDDIRNESVIERCISEKMFRKIAKVDSAAKVISYIERLDDALTLHDKKRVKRMMHYPVSLRPFLATVEVETSDTTKNVKHKNSEFDCDFELEEDDHSSCVDDSCSELHFQSSISQSNTSENTTTSPFLCTPKSFPPTPSSRAHVLARGTRFAEDVVFLARAQLRVKKGLESSNDKTRAMAEALLDGSRLAIFDVSGGIALTCGQHCASKIGDDLYCSARGMIPVLRNCFVYFEMLVSTPPLLNMMLHHASLSVGLSTLEMPLNALVGAWTGSVGLCSTGQILADSQWCLPLEPRTYGSSSTVGCLVYLDDESTFETGDGVMVPANVVFNLNGQVVTPTGVLCSSGGEDSWAGNTVKGYQRNDLHPTSSISLSVPGGEELYPTLTLHSSQTEVTCKFCAEDISAKCREEIGAPMDVTVYAVDGSVLFHEERIDQPCKDNATEI